MNSIENPDESLLSVSPQSEVRDVSLLDTTGSPLKYSFDNSAIIHMSILECQQNHWQKEEEKHWPLTLEEARWVCVDLVEAQSCHCVYRCRQFLTRYVTNQYKCQQVWCVCDGQDFQKTVLIGAQQMKGESMRTTVTLAGLKEAQELGCFFINCFKQGCDRKVIRIRIKYYIWGYIWVISTAFHNSIINDVILTQL